MADQTPPAPASVIAVNGRNWPVRVRGLNFLGHHKCASIWLRDYLTTVAARNGLTFAPTHVSDTLPDADIRFLANASYRFVDQQGLRGCHIIRNPMAMVSSAYFSHRATHPTAGWPQLDAQREALLATNQDTGMAMTLNFLLRPDFHPHALGPLLALQDWDFDDPRFLTLRMEDLVAAPAARLSVVFAFLGRSDLRLPPDAAFSFQAVSGGRAAGQIDERSHYRSGNPNDWRNNLPDSVQVMIRTRFRPLLERFFPESLMT